MKKIFLDCGTHLCEGLTHFMEKRIIDETFEIHTFEPNPECNVHERVKSLPIIPIVHQKAVWIEDGKVFFNQENHRRSGSGSPTDGYSDIDGWGSSIEGIGFEHPGYDTKVEVDSISLSRFIEELPEESMIICKMDIEGSEFAVLRDLLEKGAIRRISEIYVEFHERFMPSESEETKRQLVDSIIALGIPVHQWF